MLSLVDNQHCNTDAFDAPYLPAHFGLDEALVQVLTQQVAESLAVLALLTLLLLLQLLLDLSLLLVQLPARQPP